MGIIKGVIKETKNECHQGETEEDLDTWNHYSETPAMVLFVCVCDPWAERERERGPSAVREL